MWKGLSMVNVNGYELPAHISYSAMTTFLDCGHLYFLTRVVGLEEAPAWWFIGGSAVHEATEEYDRTTV
jgi:ATP-dependent helicase/DNAse subunit B